MSVEAFGVGNTGIANGCKGTVGDGSCYFDEFVKEISPDWSGSTSVGQDLNPPVETTVDDLVANGDYDYVAHQDKLFPKLFPDARSGTYGDVFQALGDKIKACRIKTGDIKLGTLLVNARYAISMVHDARRAEQAGNLIDEVNKLIKKRLSPGIPLFTAQTKSARISNGGTWEEVDTERTLQQCTTQGCKAKLITAVEQFIKTDFATTNKEGKRHYNAIKTVELQEDRLYGAPDC